MTMTTTATPPPDAPPTDFDRWREALLQARADAAARLAELADLARSPVRPATADDLAGLLQLRHDAGLHDWYSEAIDRAAAAGAAAP
jgi:hypothetical protein